MKFFIFLALTFSALVSHAADETQPSWRVLGLSAKKTLIMEIGKPKSFTIFLGRGTDDKPSAFKKVDHDTEIYVTAYCSRQLNCTDKVATEIIHYFPDDKISTGLELTFTPTLASRNASDNWISFQIYVGGAFTQGFTLPVEILSQN